MTTAPGDPYALRPATRDDVPAILAIYNHAVLHTTATYDYEPRTLDQRLAWYDDHERDALPIFVAVSAAGTIAGWSSLSRYHLKPGYRFTAENSIYVAEGHQGRGLGARLLAPLIDAARARGLRAIIAVIDSANEPSLRLHAKFAFEQVGHFRQIGFKFGRWLDVVYLERLIEPGNPAGT
jgi:phosphinothricin acetyltransferase